LFLQFSEYILACYIELVSWIWLMILDPSRKIGFCPLLDQSNKIWEYFQVSIPVKVNFDFHRFASLGCFLYFMMSSILYWIYSIIFFDLLIEKDLMLHFFIGIDFFDVSISLYVTFTSLHYVSNVFNSQMFKIRLFTNAISIKEKTSSQSIIFHLDSKCL
jgi:hypothetical protein